MFHSFDPAVAARYGILEAVLLRHIAFWIENNRKTGANFHNGRYWTHMTLEDFHKMLPYATRRQIQYALQKLKTAGVIETGNFNKRAYDRTSWYTVTDFGRSIAQICLMDETNTDRERNKIVPPIPDRYQDNNPDKSEAARPPFHPPTTEAVKAYCRERKNNVDAYRFVDYYDSVGWRVGKNPMRDWRAAVRRWERTERCFQQPKKKFVNPDDVCLDGVF